MAFGRFFRWRLGRERVGAWGEVFRLAFGRFFGLRLVDDFMRAVYQDAFG